GDKEEQGNDNNAAEEPVTAVDDVVDQSIQSPTPFTPPPQQPPDIPSTSHVQSPPPKQQSSLPAQPQGADFPMSLLQEAVDACAALARRVEHLKHDKVAQDLEIIMRKVGTSQRIETSDDTIIEDMSNQGRVIDESDKDEADVPAAPVNAAAVMTTAAPVKVVVPSTRQRRGVVIRDPEEESSAKIPTKTKSKDKGKGIMVEEPKPIKKKQQVELDEAYARKLQEELN
nr:hypothetical protein [Tanacetum cinerariifolium]